MTNHSQRRVEHCVSIVDRLAIDVRSVLVLGAGTGEVLEHLHKALGVSPRGCEISPQAHARIPRRYRRRIRCTNIGQYILDLLDGRKTFDLIFCNSPLPMEAYEISNFVYRCGRLCGHLHFWNDTSEAHEEGDRLSIRPDAWWSQTFRANGFAPTPDPHLWRSNRRGMRY